ncbi:MAG: DUF2304 domain-containing protein [Coriobacteriales bacterium]|jgi:hypothetical protein|nr:DUF2304 domain-containing protein [Coriobacteriales bacterium]
MSLPLRIILILGSLLTLIFFMVQIRRKRLQIDYAIYWILVSILLFIASVIPDFVVGIALVLGFESAANFIFVVIIFLLFVKLFSVTLKLSQSNQQITDLTQRLALLEQAQNNPELSHKKIATPHQSVPPPPN